MPHDFVPQSSKLSASSVEEGGNTALDAKILSNNPVMDDTLPDQILFYAKEAARVNCVDESEAFFRVARAINLANPETKPMGEDVEEVTAIFQYLESVVDTIPDTLGEREEEAPYFFDNMLRSLTEISDTDTMMRYVVTAFACLSKDYGFKGEGREAYPWSLSDAKAAKDMVLTSDFSNLRKRLPYFLKDASDSKLPLALEMTEGVFIERLRACETKNLRAFCTKYRLGGVTTEYEIIEKTQWECGTIFAPPMLTMSLASFWRVFACVLPLDGVTPEDIPTVHPIPICVSFE